MKMLKYSLLIVFSLTIQLSAEADSFTAPTIPVYKSTYDGPFARSGLISVILIKDSNESETLEFGVRGTEMDYPNAVGLIINGRFAGEFSIFWSQSARGNDYLGTLPLYALPSRNEIELENGNLEIYLRTRSGAYVSDFGRNFHFTLNR